MTDTAYAPLQSLDLSGKVALVTGASRGIGAATARLLAAYGATVIAASRTLADVEAVAKDIGGGASAAELDVADYTSVERAAQAAVDTHGSLDIWVNNAGTIAPQKLMWETDPQAWAQGSTINVVGVYNGLRAALPHMIAQKSGVVVNLSSGAANSALPGWSQYCSSKAAAKRLTEVAQRELRENGHASEAGEGVRVVGLSPGTVATDMMASIRDAKINVVSNLDWSKHIRPEWAAEGVAYLCGPEGTRYAGTDFSIKTPEGRAAVGLPQEGAPDA